MIDGVFSSDCLYPKYALIFFSKSHWKKFVEAHFHFLLFLRINNVDADTTEVIIFVLKIPVKTPVQTTSALTTPWSI